MKNRRILGAGLVIALATGGCASGDWEEDSPWLDHHRSIDDAATQLPRSDVVPEFHVEASDVTTAFDCVPGRWCTRMGNFPFGVASPPLSTNTRRYGGQTGYGPSPGFQTGLAGGDVPSTVIQFGADGLGRSAVGWFYDSDLEHGVWPGSVPTANLATGHAWPENQEVFVPEADGYVRLAFTYRIAHNSHDPDHPGNRLGGWASFTDSNTPSGERRILWIGVKPFDSENPDRTVALVDGNVQSDNLAVIVRQAIRPDAPNQFGYRGEFFGPFVQFEPASEREFQTAADGQSRHVAFRVYKANLQASIDLARRLCASDNPNRHTSCGERRTDAWSPDASQWRLYDVHVNPECPRRTGMANALGYSLHDVEAGWVSAG